MSSSNVHPSSEEGDTHTSTLLLVGCHAILHPYHSPHDAADGVGQPAAGLHDVRLGRAEQADGALERARQAGVQHKQQQQQARWVGVSLLVKFYVCASVCRDP